jgi:hypothetical protein
MPYIQWILNCVIKKFKVTKSIYTGAIKKRREQKFIKVANTQVLRNQLFSLSPIFIFLKYKFALSDILIFVIFHFN